MVVHGAAAGNFSPLNVLGAIVHQAVAQNGYEISMAMLFVSNLAYNLALAAVIVMIFDRGRRGHATAFNPAGKLTAQARRSSHVPSACESIKAAPCSVCWSSPSARSSSA